MSKIINKKDINKIKLQLLLYRRDLYFSAYHLIVLPRFYFFQVFSYDKVERCEYVFLTWPLLRETGKE